MVEPYRTVLFDFDHTLFDTAASEAEAFTAAATAVGLVVDAAELAAYQRINQALWREVERGTVTPPQIRTARFEQYCAERGFDVDPVAMADVFVEALGAHGALYDGAAAMLDHVAGHARLGLVTNGLGEVQRARAGRVGLDRWFEVIVISGEVGVAKPAAAIFACAFAALGHPDKRATLMVGDSLGADIAGGIGFGIGTCWYNPDGVAVGAGPAATHEVASLHVVPDVVTSGPPSR